MQRRFRTSGGVNDLVATIAHHLERHGMDWEDFLASWRWLRQQRARPRDSEQHQQRLEAAARTAIVEGRLPDDVAAFREVVNDTNDLLGETISTQSLDSPLLRAGRLLRTAAAAMLFAFVGYMVVGGLATHDTPLLGEGSAAYRFLVLTALLVVLGAFESLQVGVTTLRLKDLGSLAQRYPRAHSEHRKIRDTIGTNRFLAGRQVVVVLVVFLAARLTSFPEMETWPFTGREFPAFMSPWFQKVFLELGVLGALLVLWAGQLFPQFVTTKNPAGILNLPGMNLVLDTSFFIESVGLTRPADWLASWYREGPRILSSAEERYKLEVEATQGYGAIGVTKHWHIGPGSATLHYQNSIVFRRPDVQEITDRSLVMRPGALRTAFSHDLIPSRRDEARRDMLVDTELGSGDELSSEWHQVAYRLQPMDGPFADGDVLVNTAVVWYGDCSSDRIDVWSPTRYLLFRLTFEEGCQADEVVVEIDRRDEMTSEQTPSRRVIPVTVRDDATSSAEFFEQFPEINTSYSFRWRVTSATRPSRPDVRADLTLA